MTGLKGRITKITKNSWVKHLSFSYNERYNFLIRMTWAGYSFFATIALSIALMKGMLVTLLIHIYFHFLCAHTVIAEWGQIYFANFHLIIQTCCLGVF